MQRLAQPRPHGHVPRAPDEILEEHQRRELQADRGRHNPICINWSCPALTGPATSSRPTPVHVHHASTGGSVSTTLDNISTAALSPSSTEASASSCSMLSTSSYPASRNAD